MATEVTLKVRERSENELGSAASRHLRRQGWVPATMYGRGAEPRSVAVPALDLRRALTTDAGRNVLLTLDFEGDRDELTLAREVQLHPTRDEYLHLDLILISRTEKVSAEVPVTLVGSATGVVDEGGILEQALYSLSIRALPTEIPDKIEVDVSSLALGSSMTVVDVAIPEGAELMTDLDAPLASVLAPAAEEVPEEVEEEAVEALEAEEAAGAAEERPAEEGAGARPEAEGEES